MWSKDQFTPLYLDLRFTNVMTCYLQVVTASGRQVVLADQKASNGVIHEVSGMLFPAAGTITYVVSKCPVFSTLLKAVGAAKLATTLAGRGC